jgi:hypothetical protein
MFLKSLFGVVILAFASGTVALADPPTVSIEQQATLVLVAVEVVVDVNCGDGPSLAALEVSVRQGDEVGSRVFPFEATGMRQEVPVLVPGVFVPGEASASAALFCGATPPMLTGFDLGATIKISGEPSEPTLP